MTRNGADPVLPWLIAVAILSILMLRLWHRPRTRPPQPRKPELVPCPYCGGSGKVKIAQTRLATGESGIYASVCTMCHGAGRVRTG
jgi:hypothetical protein